MQYPAVILPYSTVDPAKDPKEFQFEPRSELDQELGALCESPTCLLL